MRVLICGGRQFEDAGFLWKTMDDLSAATPISEVLVRGSAGADTLAEHWAKDRRVSYRVFLANWNAYGRGASTIRNQEMLEYGKPDLIVAFPGDRDTADIVMRARAAGLPVREVGGGRVPGSGRVPSTATGKGHEHAS
jgi:hypothetical protein